MSVSDVVKRFSGFSLSALLRVLRTYLPTKRGRLTASGACSIIAVTICAAATSALSLVEQLLYSARLAKTPEPSAPLFVLGYFRSGTTMAINAVTASSRHVTYLPLFVAYFPHTSLVLRPIRYMIGRWWLGELREGDAVDEGVDSPVEDDHGLMLINGSGTYGQTLFLTASVTPTAFCSHVVAAAPPDEQERFFASMDILLKRAVAYNALGDPSSTDRLMCLKSCSHTCRMLALSQHYPGARFLYVHRHPYDVYRSMVPHLRSWDQHTTLDNANDATLREATLTWYEWFIDAYLDQRARLPPETRLVEMSYDELTRDSEAAMLRIGEALGVPIDRAALSAHCASLKGYRRNQHPPLSPDEKALLQLRWARAFEAFGYSREADG